MRVCIFGATGFIGLPLAQNLVRAGHEVIGITRSAEHKEMLEREEIEAYVCDTTKSNDWIELIPRLDAIVDAAGGSNIQTHGMEKFKAIEQAAKKRHPSAGKLTSCYIGGTWCTGDSLFERKSDGAAALNPTPLTAWRLDIEHATINSTVLNGFVVRPALVYGRGASITGMLFEQAFTKKSIDWPGNRGSRFNTIHTDDVGELIRLAIEKAPIAQGNVFDCSNAGQESVYQISWLLAQLAGFSEDKIGFHEPKGDFELALTTARPLQPVLGRSLLGWQPLKPTLTDGECRR